ncbi:MAG: response regulator, partial [Pseudomonadota bacterium]
TGANDETEAAAGPDEMVEFEATSVGLNQPSMDESDAEQPTDTAAQLTDDSLSLELSLVPLREDAKPADGKLFQIDESADHHEAFIGRRGVSLDAVSKINDLLPQISKELALVVNERLASLGVANDTVQSEIMVESKESPVADILAAGFEPILAVCPAPLAALQNLTQIEVDTIHVSLVQVADGRSCNRLFADDFEFAIPTAGDADPDPIQDIQSDLDTLEFDSPSALLDEPSSELREQDSLEAYLEEENSEFDTLSLDGDTTAAEAGSFEGFLGEVETSPANATSVNDAVGESTTTAVSFEGFLSDFEPRETDSDDSEVSESLESKDSSEFDGFLGDTGSPHGESTNEDVSLVEDAAPITGFLDETEDSGAVSDEIELAEAFLDSSEAALSDTASDSTADENAAASIESFSDEAEPAQENIGTIDPTAEDSVSGDTQSIAHENVLDEVQPAFDIGDQEEEIFEGFGDDLFADDLLATASTHEQTDIDALFDDLEVPEEDSDAICGLDVEEFSAASEPADSEVESVVVQMTDAAQEASESTAVPAQPHVPDALDEEQTPVAEPEPDTGLQTAAHLNTSVLDGEFNCIPEGIKFSDASPGGGEIFADFLEAFVEEGSSEIEKLEDAVAAWERDIASEEAFAVVGRVLHTIKGIAKGVGLHHYGTLVHNFETLLGAMARPDAGAEGEYFRVVNAWLDACVRGLDHIQDARSDIPYVLPQTGAQAHAVTPAATDMVSEAAATEAQSQDSESEREAKRERVDTKARKQSQKIADDGAKVLAAQQSIRITSEKLDDMLKLSNEAQQLGVRTAQSVTRGKRASTEMQHRLGSLRSHISAIADRALRSVAARGVKQDASMDALEMDQYSELQEAANILREGVEDLADLVDFANRQNAQVEALLKHQTNVISSIGSSIRAARVVPVSRLMPGLRRLVRTVSVDLNKTVNFRVLNEIGTLDRDDYARCQTILDHMVRNALDHGIEAAKERKAAGKPEEGLISIDIRKAGADSIITLSDDGRGIDPQKMRESAIAKGLEVNVESLSDDEAAQLIFHKGFSTAGSVSQISGRGVGMDIVLTELQEMGGDIQINSEPGKGTSFDIRVPSSITVNGALLVSAGEQSYAIPLGGLIGVEQVPVDEFFAAVQGNTLLSVAGMDCEPAYLATLCRTGHSLDAKTWRTSVPVVVAGSDERRMAIAVDDVEEALELVIRSLGAQFADVPGVAGAATTAAGEAIVALDLNLLVDSVGEDDRSPLHVGADREEALTVMVVDDSRTQRMVATSQLETVGVETITAENGSVAIDLLNSADRLPDIILMDVEMPVKDGIQALREIRKSVRYGHVPVIMVTSRTGLKHRAMAQAAGCNGYMGKPFNFRMLIGQINELTGHRLQLS